MTNRQSISIYTKEADKNLIVKAAQMFGLDFSAFCRSASLEKARKILKENEEVLSSDE